MDRTEIIAALEPFKREADGWAPYHKDDKGWDDLGIEFNLGHIRTLAKLHDDMIAEELASIKTDMDAIKFSSEPSAQSVIDTVMHAGRQGWINAAECTRLVEDAEREVVLQRRRLEQARTLRGRE